MYMGTSLKFIGSRKKREENIGSNKGYWILKSNDQS